MNAKFKIGEVVRTLQGSEFVGEGPIHNIVEPSRELRLLWGNDDLHYIIRDNETGEFISVIEGSLERV